MINVESFVRQQLAEFEGSDCGKVPQNRERYVKKLLAMIDPERIARFAAHDEPAPEAPKAAACAAPCPRKNTPRAA